MGKCMNPYSAIHGCHLNGIHRTCPIMHINASGSAQIPQVEDSGASYQSSSHTLVHQPVLLSLSFALSPHPWVQQNLESLSSCANPGSYLQSVTTANDNYASLAATDLSKGPYDITSGLPSLSIVRQIFINKLVDSCRRRLAAGGPTRPQRDGHRTVRSCYK